jgi:hypothetical protein
MKSIKALKWILLSIVFTLSFTSCSKDSDTDVTAEDFIQSDDGEYCDIAENVVVLTYDKFLQPSDVNIESSDTTLISVNNELIKELNVSIKAGTKLSIWRTANTVPFIREVTAANQKGDQLILTTKGAEISDFIENANVLLSTSPYINTSASSSSMSRSERYQEGNTFHPAVILTDQNNDGINEVYTAEDIINSRANINLFDKKIGVNFTCNPIPDSTSVFSIGIDNGEMHVYSNFIFSLNISWFKLRKFDCYVNGGVEANLPLTIKLKNDIAAFNKDIQLTYFKGYTAIFWVYAIPVAITMGPNLYFATEGKATAGITFTVPIKYNCNYAIGPKYDIDTGWECLHDWSSNTMIEKNSTKISGGITANFNAGIYLRAGAYIYGCAGPVISFGPKIEAKFQAEKIIETKSTYIKVATTGNFAVGCSVGAKLKIAKWELASIEFKFPALYEKELWNKSYIIK